MEPFISVDDLNAYTNSEYTGNELLTGIVLDSGCQAVRDYLAQSINLERGGIERIDGTGRESIILTELPVVDVLSVTEDGEELVEDDDYVWGRNGIIWRRSTTFALAWSRGRQNIEVVYDHGWAITEDDVVDPESGDEPAVDRVPADIRIVALAIAVRLLRASTVSVGSAGIVGETIGDYSYQLDTAQASEQTQLALLDTERAALDHWKPGVGT